MYRVEPQNLILRMRSQLVISGYCYTLLTSPRLSSVTGFLVERPVQAVKGEGKADEASLVALLTTWNQLYEDSRLGCSEMD